jgi:hypothetical protein
MGLRKILDVCNLLTKGLHDMDYMDCWTKLKIEKVSRSGLATLLI